MENNIKSILSRYLTGTSGLFLVSVGVALSIKSDLGTSPISCPPYVASLIGGFDVAGIHVGTVGQYTIMMHFIFILLQIALLRKRFKMESLMQIPAALVFGFLTDLSIWALDWISPESYAMRLVLMASAIVVTAFGVSLEVMGKAWMLAGEMTTAAVADFLGAKFRNTKIGFDITLVIIAAAISWFCFGNPLGDGTENVIREGTVVSALFTGLCMRFTDKAVGKMLGGRIH